MVEPEEADDEETMDPFAIAIVVAKSSVAPLRLPDGMVLVAVYVK